MRFLESVVVVMVAGAIAWRLVRSAGNRTHRIAALATAVVCVLQLGFEGYRWQLVPGWVTTALLGFLAFSGFRQVTRPRWRLIGWIGVGVLVVVLPVLVPIPELRTPDGPYPIGTVSVVLTDASRAEIYGPNPGGDRTLPIHIWYPAVASAQASPGWLDRGSAGSIAHEFGLPGFFLDHLGLTRTHAPVGIAVAPGGARFPVVIYSHGWTGFGRISPDQPEQLASHGFIVIAPDHTYGAMVAQFPGALIPYDPAALPDEETVSEAEYTAASRTLVATFAADIRFVLDSLPTLVTDDLGLAERLDLDRVGIYGHSTGGGAAVYVCAVDTRCDAVLGFDPWVEPVPDSVIATGLGQPFLAIRSDVWVDLPNDQVLRALHESGAGPSALLAIAGTNHYDFVALSQISPLAGVFGFKGPIPGPKAQEILGSELVWFFDSHLRGGSGDPPSFKELRVDAIRQ